MKILLVWLLHGDHIDPNHRWLIMYPDSIPLEQAKINAQEKCIGILGSGWDILKDHSEFDFELLEFDPNGVCEIF